MLNINKIFDDNLEDCMEEINLNNNDNNKVLKNIILISRYHNRIHLISYLYLKNLNQIFLFIFITTSFISGIVEIINYNLDLSQDIYLVFGLINIFLSLILVTYKSLKIPNTEQEHYNYHIQYKNLINEVNLNTSLYKKPSFIYKNLDVYLINVINTINKFNLRAPKIPNNVLVKYKIKELKSCKSNYNLRMDSVYDSVDIDIDNLQALTNTNKNMEIKSSTFNKSLNKYNVGDLSTYDIDNLNDFINKIDSMKYDKSKDDKFSKFKDSLRTNKN